MHQNIENKALKNNQVEEILYEKIDFEELFRFLDSIKIVQINNSHKKTKIEIPVKTINSTNSVITNMTIVKFENHFIKNSTIKLDHIDNKLENISSSNSLSAQINNDMINKSQKLDIKLNSIDNQKIINKTNIKIENNSIIQKENIWNTSSNQNKNKEEKIELNNNYDHNNKDGYFENNSKNYVNNEMQNNNKYLNDKLTLKNKNETQLNETISNIINITENKIEEKENLNNTNINDTGLNTITDNINKKDKINEIEKNNKSEDSENNFNNLNINLNIIHSEINPKEELKNNKENMKTTIESYHGENNLNYINQENDSFLKNKDDFNKIKKIGNHTAYKLIPKISRKQHLNIKGSEVIFDETIIFGDN